MDETPNEQQMLDFVPSPESAPSTLQYSSAKKKDRIASMAKSTVIGVKQITTPNYFKIDRYQKEGIIYKGESNGFSTKHRIPRFSSEQNNKEISQIKVPVLWHREEEKVQMRSQLKANVSSLKGSHKATMFEKTTTTSPSGAATP